MQGVFWTYLVIRKILVVSITILDVFIWTFAQVSEVQPEGEICHLLKNPLALSIPISNMFYLHIHFTT